MRVKTSSKKQESIESLLKQIAKGIDDINKNIKKSSTLNEIKDNSSKKLISTTDSSTAEKRKALYEKKLKALQDKRDLERWDRRLDTVQSVSNAIMPADRRQVSVASGIGLALGIDPGVVQLLGLDKAVSSIWNSKFGFKAIKDRHHNKIEEQRLRDALNESQTDESEGKLKKESENTKRLKNIDKNVQKMAGDKSSDEGGIPEDKKKKDSLLTKLLFGGLALIGGGLLIGSLIKGGMFKKFLGETVGAALPGAIAGGLIATMFGGSLLHGAMIGAVLTLSASTILNAADSITNLFRDGEISNIDMKDALLKGAITGGLISASILGDLTISGIADGALVGASIGAISAAASSLDNQLEAAKRGEYVPPKTIDFGGGVSMSYNTFTGIVLGATIGNKVGGPAGLLLGAAIGGIAGKILGWGTDLWAQHEAEKNKGKKILQENYSDNPIVQGINEAKHESNQLKSTLNTQINDIEGAKKLGVKNENASNLKNIKFDEALRKDAAGGVRDIETMLKKDVARLTEMDKNSDQEITPGEYLQWLKDNKITVNKGFWSIFNPYNWGSKGNTVNRVDTMFGISGNQAFSIDDYINHIGDTQGLKIYTDQINELSQAYLSTNKTIPTASQITANKIAQANTDAVISDEKATKENTEKIEELNTTLTLLLGGNPQANAEANANQTNNPLTNLTGAGSVGLTWSH